MNNAVMDLVKLKIPGVMDHARAVMAGALLLLVAGCAPSLRPAGKPMATVSFVLGSDAETGQDSKQAIKNVDMADDLAHCSVNANTNTNVGISAATDVHKHQKLFSAR